MFGEHHTLPFDLSAKYGFDCDAAQTGYLNACSSESTFQDYQRLSRFWREEQGQKVDFLDSADMQRMTGSSYYPYGVLYRSGGRVNPYLFTHGMISVAVQKGAAVYGNSEAITLGKFGERWKVSSAKGSVTADRVVFCTNAYPTGIVPQVTNNFYPLTAYALSTKPLSPQALKVINPGKATIAQVPVDLNPFIIDGNNRIIISSIPSAFSPEDANLHFRNHLAWIHRTWPQAKEFDIELESYWTGRVALRNKEFPGVFELGSGVYGLMHFNAWGNVMAPLLGMLMAEGLTKDQMYQLPFPLEEPQPVSYPNKQDLIIRKLLIPAARLGQKMGFI
jgi:glycine/D-amino acid oxidase-like deaminating enzyme